MLVLRRLLDRIATFFEEPEVARYVTLVGSAGGFTIPDSAAGLPLSDRHFQDIHAPGLIPGSQPVIFFRTAHTKKPRFSVRLNSTPLTQHSFSGSETIPHAWHEIVPAGALKPADNELTFAVSGDGDVRFSDVVILYRSNQLTMRRPLPEPVVQA